MRTWVTLLLAGCAPMAPPATPQTAKRECTIAEPRWPSTDDDYDRGATLDALGALERVISDAAARGPDEVARRLDELFRKPAGNAFVSRWAAAAAVRLRQLACAQYTGRISQTEADSRYVQVINDIEDERGVIVDEMRRRR